MNILLNRKRFIELIHSEKFLIRFKGKHIINPDNIDNYSDLEGELEKFKEALPQIQKQFEISFGRNKYVYRNFLKVVKDNIEQLEYIIQKYTG